MEQTLRSIAGYLNFSRGAASPAFRRAVGEYARVEGMAWGRLAELLQDDAAFPPEAWARSRWVAQAIVGGVLPGYRVFHADVLRHAVDETLFQPFAIARIAEIALANIPEDPAELGPVPGPTDRRVVAWIERLSDFLGHRPVPVLENAQLGQPYRREAVMAIPVWFRSVGVAEGPWKELVAELVKTLEAENGGAISALGFEFSNCEEIAVDPRPYDHAHPSNQRPAYCFSEWDPHRIDKSGNFCRLILRQPIMDTMLAWAKDRGGEGVMVEGGAALAGTVLLGAGVSGRGPGSFSAETTLGHFVPKLAAARDAFFKDLVAKWPGKQGDRLRKESEQDRQPFGRVRRHINTFLAAERAHQLLGDRLSQFYAKLGFAAAAEETLQSIHAVSSRFRCELQNRLWSCRQQAKAGQWRKAALLLPHLVERLKQGIDCGAFPDPWSILGFQANYPLFVSPIDSVRDGRVDEFLSLVQELLSRFGDVAAEAANGGDSDVADTVLEDMGNFADWWDKFATFEVSDVLRVKGQETTESARFVCQVLLARQAAGEAANEPAFWRNFADGFQSSDAFARVLSRVLDAGQVGTVEAMLPLWLGRREQDLFADEQEEFSQLCERAIAKRRAELDAAGTAGDAPRVFRRLGFFLDSLEANADDWWQAPDLADFTDLGGIPVGGGDDDEDDNPFEAAREGVTFEDSADDGNDGSLMEVGGGGGDSSFSELSERLLPRLRFLNFQSRAWLAAGAAPWHRAGDEERSRLAGWVRQALSNRTRLVRLMDALEALPKPEPASGEVEAHEYDRQQSLRADLLEEVVDAAVAQSAAALRLAAWLDNAPANLLDWEVPYLATLRLAANGEVGPLPATLGELLHALAKVRVLYVPLSLGGQPRDLLTARSVRDCFRRLAVELPRLAMFDQTHRLLDACQEMERNGLTGSRQVTEFNLLFQFAYRGVIREVIDRLGGWLEGDADDERAFRCVADLVERFGRLWRRHTKNVRLSELERFSDDRAGWQEVVKFIKEHGRELFTQAFMSPSNLRAILQQGVGFWLNHARKEKDDEMPKFRRAISRREKFQEAERVLDFILTSVLENYESYKEYNSTTTQSDYGDNLDGLLELLRLRAAYDRKRWTMAPVYQAHRELAYANLWPIADRLGELLTEQTTETAEELEDQLKAAESRVRYRLATVADMIRERFVKPLRLHRVLALIPACWAERGRADSPALAALRAQLKPFKEVTHGGLDAPDWLREMETELERVSSPKADPDLAALSPRVPMTPAQFERQMEDY